MTPRKGDRLFQHRSNTGARLPGELLITCNISAVAVCCSRASLSSRVRAPTCFCRSAMDWVAVDTLRVLGLFARRPLTACSLPPRCRISLPSGWGTTRFHLIQFLGFAPWQSAQGQTRLPPWGPHVRFRRVQTLVREGSPLVRLRPTGGVARVAPHLEASEQQNLKCRTGWRARRERGLMRRSRRGAELSRDRSGPRPTWLARLTTIRAVIDKGLGRSELMSARH